MPMEVNITFFVWSVLEDMFSKVGKVRGIRMAHRIGNLTAGQIVSDPIRDSCSGNVKMYDTESVPKLRGRYISSK